MSLSFGARLGYYAVTAKLGHRLTKLISKRKVITRSLATVK